MPDWRKAAAYRRLRRKLPNYLWAWEFLRRNREYRRDWEAALAQFKTRSDADARTLLSAEDIPEDFEFYLPVEERKKWSLVDGLLNPATDTPAHLRFDADWGILRVHEPGETPQPGPGGKRYPWAVFDAQLPISPQLRRLEEQLKWQQEYVLKVKPPRPKHHRDLWPLYVRLLDADLEGFTARQIADTLDPERPVSWIDEGRVWDHLGAARKMTRPEGYLSIFLTPTREIRTAE